MMEAQRPNYMSWKSFREVEHHAAAIDAAVASFNRSKIDLALTAGAELAAAHAAMCKKGEGTYRRWCRLRLHVSQTQADRWLRVHFIFGADGERAKMAHSFRPSALYKLVEPATPGRVLQKALQLARDGKTGIRLKEILLLLAEDRAAQPKGASWDEICAVAAPPKEKPKKPTSPSLAQAAQKFHAAWAEAKPPERKQHMEALRRSISLLRFDEKEPLPPDALATLANHPHAPLLPKFLIGPLKAWVDGLTAMETKTLQQAWEGPILQAAVQALRSAMCDACECDYYATLKDEEAKAARRKRIAARTRAARRDE